MKSLSKVAIILPSRGLLFSQTADEILHNVRDVPHKFYFSHKQPIPDCFEVPVNKALKDKENTHIWLVEDDMILPPNVLKDMLDVDKAVVTVNYPTTIRRDSAILTVKGRIVYAGTGCTLVKREVFEELKKPYFRSDIAWIPKNIGGYIKFAGVKHDAEKGYGLHDVNFFINLYKLNIPVHQLPYTVGQRKLISLGKAGSNDGAHNIEKWTKVKKDRYFTLIKNLPKEAESTLTTVVVGDKELMTSKSHAKTLIDKGLGSPPPKRYVVIDDSEVL